MVPVRKPEGSVRLCIDYRKVNQLTNPNPCHMPRVEDMVEQLGEASFLTKLDLTKAYYQIPVAKGDRIKASFCTLWGKFQFRRMQKCPATFQRVTPLMIFMTKISNFVFKESKFEASHLYRVYKEYRTRKDCMDRRKDPGLQPP